jgi:hypothetical protein
MVPKAGTTRPSASSSSTPGVVTWSPCRANTYKKKVQQEFKTRTRAHPTGCWGPGAPTWFVTTMGMSNVAPMPAQPINKDTGYEWNKRLRAGVWFGGALHVTG